MAKWKVRRFQKSQFTPNWQNWGKGPEEKLESLLRMWQEAEGGLQDQLEGMEGCQQALHGPGVDLSSGIPDETEILG